MHIVSLFRYPVKSLAGQALERVEARAGRTLAGDRRYALERTPGSLAPDSAGWRPKTFFRTLARDPKMFGFAVAWDALFADPESSPDDGVVSPAARATLEARMARRLGAPAGARLVRSQTGALTDESRGWLSVVNLGSVRALARATGRAIAPDVFRANVYVDGVAPWSETTWIGRQMATHNGVRMAARETTGRCAAIDIGPNGQGMAVRHLLARETGRVDMGVYVEVVTEGELRCGDGFDVATDDPTQNRATRNGATA